MNAGDDSGLTAILFTKEQWTLTVCSCDAAVNTLGSVSETGGCTCPLCPITPTRMRRNQSRSHETRIEKNGDFVFVDL